MQGQRGAIGSLPESLDFAGHGTSSGDGLGQPVFWNNLRSSAQNRLPGFVVSSNDAYIAPSGQERQNSVVGWNLGESSSSVVQSQAGENEPKMGFDSSNIVSLNDVEVNLSSSLTAGSLPRDLNANPGIEGDETNDDDDCQLLEFITTYGSGVPTNELMPSSGPSGSSARTEGYLSGQSGSLPARPGSSTEGRRLSCKRKAVEGHSSGQSSGSGSSSYFQHPESSVWHNTPVQHNIGVNFADQINPRLGLSIGGGAASQIPVGLSTSRNPEASRRNSRQRVNAAHQQGSIPRNLFPLESVLPGNTTSPLDFRHTAIPESPNPQGHAPTLRRQAQTRWNVGSSSRGGSPTSYAETDLMQSAESAARDFPRTISQHPMFTHAPSLVPNRALPQHPRQLTEFVRRSLLASASAESAGQSNRISPQPHPISQETPLSGRRHLDPYSWRTLAGGGEGRNRLVSEIHNVLDLMRRGEGLRFEDVMILDPSVLFGMTDLHDRHRDMRLDVDNMSYEELLALEERIGNVCTGLNEETISNRLKRRKYTCVTTEDQVEREPCCICQEEYNGGDDLGMLDCGHDFHANCVKQWLKQKNSCPVCKTTGLATT